MTLGNVLAFRVVTVPDVELGRRLHGLEGLSDKQVGYVMQTRQREETGSEFLSVEQHCIVAIAVALRTAAGFEARSIGEPGTPEAELVQRFHAEIERHAPVLVSWHGSGFDLPVLAYRALRHRVRAQLFQRQHVDLMETLAGTGSIGRVRLDNVAQLLGLPGRPGGSDERVRDAHLEGRVEDIRNDCETDVLNAYLVYLRLELARGRLDAAGHERECVRVREFLQRSGVAHLRRYLDAWPAPGA